VSTNVHFKLKIPLFLSTEVHQYLLPSADSAVTFAVNFSRENTLHWLVCSRGGIIGKPARDSASALSRCGFVFIKKACSYR